MPTPEEIARVAAMRLPGPRKTDWPLHALTPSASMRARPTLPEGTVLYTVWGEAGVRSSDAGWRAAGVETICLLERVRRG